MVRKAQQRGKWKKRSGGDAAKSVALDQHFEVNHKKHVAYPISARSIPNKTQCGDRVSVQDWAQGSMKHHKVELPSRN